MLDLSPYMLIYNYGSKALPLKNMQEITVNLLKQLVRRYKQDQTYDYNISIHLFTIYNKNIETVLQNEPINEESIDSLCQFVNSTIEHSQLPHLKDIQKHSICDLMQQALCHWEASVGIRSLVIVSSFN